MTPDDPDERLAFADLSMDLATREVRRGARSIELTRTEFSLLELFLRRPRRVLDRSFILEEVWGFDFPTTANSLEVYVGYVRRKTRGGGRATASAHRPRRRLRPARPTGLMGAWYRPHYRRSLASRVTLLTTMAVGLAVTAVSLATFLTVRSQSMSALDDSLRERAAAAAKFDALRTLSQQRYPSQVFGAADVRIIFVDADTGHAFSADRTTNMKVSAAEYEVASGKSAYSARTILADGQRYRMVAVPADGHGMALVLAQSLEPTDRMLGRLGLVALLIGLAGVIAAALAGWARGPQRPAPGAACSRTPPRTSPAPSSWTRSPSRATTRSPGSPPRSTRCSPRSPPRATGSDSWSPTPATSCEPR